MSVQMIGMDHSLAGIEVREKFSFTKKQAGALMEKWKGCPGVHGIVLLSTCNRVEIYVNSEREDLDLCGMLCEEKGADRAEYGSLFCVREGAEAVRHLFEMTAGLCSMFIGEDQILTQVKDALSFAREKYMADKVLEVLFRRAVTTAKEIKAGGFLHRADLSAAGEAIAGLKKKNMALEGKECLVIGNGIMGRLTAQTLLGEGAKVTVTVRQYHRGIVDIPEGAVRIDYGKRYEILPECDYVFSATSSPNVTLTRDALERCGLRKEQVYVDLAVPRDIDPSVRELDYVTLYDLDDFSRQEISEEMRQGMEHALRMAEQGAEDFQSWYECRELVPAVRKISHLAAADLCGRMEKPLRQIEGEQRKNLAEALESSADKVTARLLFALRDGLDAECFRECLEILEQRMQ